MVIRETIFVSFAELTAVSVYEIIEMVEQSPLELSTKWRQEWSLLSADARSPAFPATIPASSNSVRKDIAMLGSKYLDEKVKQPISIAMTMAVTALVVAMVALAVALGGPK